jgi:hypothetical protein
LLVLPALVAGVFFQSFIIGFVVYCLAYGMFLLFVVRKLSIDDNGILFVRVLGSPKILKWTDIESIEKVSRKELILRGWLWPLFPAREMTACLSSKNHFRIKWRDGFCYFPPRHEGDFEELIRKYIKST